MYSQDFYYYKNEKLKLELNTQYLNVLCNINSKENLAKLKTETDRQGNKFGWYITAL